MALSVESVSNFRRDGISPTTFDVQALIANHFVLLWWKHLGSERQLKASRKVGKVSGTETNESKPTDDNLNKRVKYEEPCDGRLSSTVP